MSTGAPEVYSAVHEYVANELMGGDAKGLDGKTPLLDLGIIDSLRIVTLLTFLETRFAVVVPETEMVPTNFGTLDGIVALVMKHLAKA